MLTERGRAAADVDCNVQDSPPYDADQLGLGGWRKLEMQSAQSARQLRARHVVLDKAAGDADLAQLSLVKGFAEPATAIDMPIGSDNPRQVHRHRRASTHLSFERQTTDRARELCVAHPWAAIMF